MSVIAYKCPNCGGGLQFNPEKQKLACEFCLSDFTDAEIAALYAEHEKAAAARVKRENNAKGAPAADGEDFMQHTRAYECSSCGAQIFAEETTAATFCYYCHNPVVLAGQLSGEACPVKLVPFVLDRAAAVGNFLDWVAKKRFVPKNFFSAAQIGHIAGVYYPFWLTDSDVEARLRAVAYNIRTWSSGDYCYTETSTFHIVREGAIHFEDIVTAALKKADKKLLAGILPYPVSAVGEFSLPRLSGFLAEKRDVEREAVQGEVDGKIAAYAEKMLRGTIAGYGSVTVQAASCDILASNWDYTLMPVWILTYNDPRRQRRYTYALNGVTGAAFGELPVNPARLAVLFSIVSAAVFGVLTLMGGFLF